MHDRRGDEVRKRTPSELEGEIASAMETREYVMLIDDPAAGGLRATGPFPAEVAPGYIENFRAQLGPGFEDVKLTLVPLELESD